MKTKMVVMMVVLAVLLSAGTALAKSDAEQARDMLLAMTKDKDTNVRSAAWKSLTENSRAEQAKALLLKMKEDPDEKISKSAWKSLLQLLRDEDVIQACVEAVKDDKESHSIRIMAIKYLYDVSDLRISLLFIEIAKTSGSSFYEAVIGGLATRTCEGVSDFLIQEARDCNWSSSYQGPAIEALKHQSGWEVTRELYLLASHNEGCWAVRKAVEVLEYRAESEGYEVSEEFQRDKEKDEDENALRRHNALMAEMRSWDLKKDVLPATRRSTTARIFLLEQGISSLDLDSLLLVAEGYNSEVYYSDSALDFMVAAAQSLARFSQPEATQALLDFAESERSVIREAAFAGLAGRTSNDPSFRKAYLENFGFKRYSDGRQVLYAEMKTWPLGYLLKEVPREPNHVLAGRNLALSEHPTSPQAREDLLGTLRRNVFKGEDGSWLARNAVICLKPFQDPGVDDTFLDLLKGDELDRGVRWELVKAVGERMVHWDMDRLKATRKRVDDPRIQVSIARALGKRLAP